MRKSVTGFTIVELLIVIVVIAILAAISLVAYTGIQNRAHDTAVQSDLSNFARKAGAYYAINGVYPSAPTHLPDLEMQTSKSAYDTSITLNFSYCATGGGAGYAIGGISKSGKRFFVSSRSGVAEYSSTLTADGNRPDLDANCSDLLPGAGRVYAGFYGSWRAWTGN